LSVAVLMRVVVPDFPVHAKLRAIAEGLIIANFGEAASTLTWHDLATSKTCCRWKRKKIPPVGGIGAMAVAPKICPILHPLQGQDLLLDAGTGTRNLCYLPAPQKGSRT